MRAEPAEKDWIVRTIQEGRVREENWVEKTAPYPLEFDRLKELFQTTGNEEQAEFLRGLRFTQQELYEPLYDFERRTETLRANLKTISELQEYARTLYLQTVENP